MTCLTNVLSKDRVDIALEWFIHGHTQQQIALRRGCTQQAVAQRLNTIQRRLQRLGLNPLPRPSRKRLYSVRESDSLRSPCSTADD